MSCWAVLRDLPSPLHFTSVPCPTARQPTASHRIIQLSACSRLRLLCLPACQIYTPVLDDAPSAVDSAKSLVDILPHAPMQTPRLGPSARATPTAATMLPQETLAPPQSPMGGVVQGRAGPGAPAPESAAAYYRPDPQVKLVVADMPVSAISPLGVSCHCR